MKSRISCLLLLLFGAIIAVVYTASIIEIDIIKTEDGFLINEIVYDKLELDAEVMKEMFGYENENDLKADGLISDSDSEFEDEDEAVDESEFKDEKQDFDKILNELSDSDDNDTDFDHFNEI